MLEDDKQSGASSLSEQLRDMAENLSVDLGPSEDDRQALREAARLLEVEASRSTNQTGEPS